MESVEVAELLKQQRSGVLTEAVASLGRFHNAHYERSGEELTRERVAELCDLVITALRDRQLEPVRRYCEGVAEKRFEAGFEILEVQTAFNVLEETMWRRVLEAVQPAELPEAIGLLSTIFGFGKDVLARRYVALASQRHVPTLDLTTLFQGVASQG